MLPGVKDGETHPLDVYRRYKIDATERRHGK
jgi:hypothetical protein